MVGASSEDPPSGAVCGAAGREERGSGGVVHGRGGCGRSVSVRVGGGRGVRIGDRRRDRGVGVRGRSGRRQRDRLVGAGLGDHVVPRAGR
ncbi:hypothetical protein XF36_00750 [Pseudonocardia sp. HH130629-09]|nr:hypothetical protein XF36_00750 [Pseudonocardia sp. HH130629-09]